MAVAGDGGAINGRRLGKWLSANQNRIMDGMKITADGVLTGIMRWRLAIDADATAWKMRGDEAYRDLRYPACGTAPPRGTGVLLSALSVYQAALGARMAESSSGNNGMLYMIVGALVVVVAVGAFIMFGGHMPGQSDSKTMSIKVEVPSLDKK